MRLNSNLPLINGSLSGTKLRLSVVIFVFAFLFCCISYKLIYISTFGIAKEVVYGLKKNRHYRRNIVDSKGVLLATNVPSASLFANPSKIGNKDEAIRKLKGLFPSVDVKKLADDFNSNKSFVWVKRDLNPKEQIRVYSLGIHGLEFENEQKRIYTYGNLMSHVLGYVGRDNQGLGGLEGFLNSTMIQEGENVQLSIDIRVQNIVYEELSDVISKHNALGGIGVVVDPNTGQVIAMVSKPDFDPHDVKGASKDSIFNRASLGVYDIGSSFKTVTFAMGFDTKNVATHDVYNLNSNFRVANFTLKDFRKREGWNTVGEIFLHSSNIGAAQIAFEVGENKFREYLSLLGLLDPLSLEIQERGRPLFPRGSRWSDLTLATMSYGYGLCVSPMHFVQANIPIVNGGVMYPLTLLKQKQEGKQILHKSTSTNMRKLMRLVVKQGTGRKADVPGYSVGGKTGTANKLKGSHYVNNSRFSSFIGVFPSTSPKFLVYVLLDDPQGTKETFEFATGGFTAAPTVGKIISRIVALYGLEPISDKEEESLRMEYEVKNAT